MVTIKEPAVYDTSHWERVPDFALVSPRPVLVITKATEGIVFVDPVFGPYMQDMQQDGIARGAFHFHRKAFSPREQADHFIRTIRPYVTKKDVLVLDFEEGGETASQLIAFLDRLQSAYPENIILNYSSRHIMNTIAMTQTQKDFLRRFPTWIAGYPFNPDQFSSIPDVYVPDQTKWGPPWLWQYTDEGLPEGTSGDGTDCNWISPVFLERLQITDPPNNGDTMEEKWKVTWDQGANRRPAPNTNNSPVPPPLPDNALFNVVEYFVPTGKTESQEHWGKLPDGLWVALTYNSQVRAERVEVEPPPSTMPVELRGFNANGDQIPGAVWDLRQ